MTNADGATHGTTQTVPVSIPPASEETASASGKGATQLRPEPVAEEDSWSGIRWVWRWVKAIAWPRRAERGSTRKLAHYFRWGTVAITAVGVGFAIGTRERIASGWVQAPVVLALLTFVSVGFWMLRWSDARTEIIGWIFCSGGAVGALVYTVANYSNLAFDKRLTGAVVAGWAADVLLLPSIAVFASLLLAALSVDHWEWLPLRLGTVLCGLTAGGFLLAGMALEPRLVSYTETITAPLADNPLAGRWTTSLLIGAVALIASMVLGIVGAWKNKPDHNAWKWYKYGGLAALLAFVPYLGVTLAEWPFSPSAKSAARAGVGALALIALAAIPATVGEQWRPNRMKRLMRGAVIATIAAAAHEWLVHSAVERVVSEPPRDPQLGGQFLLTYEFTLLALAVLMEPFAMAFDAASERVAYWRSPPDDLVEEALEDLRASRTKVNRAKVLAARLVEIDAAGRGARSWRRWMPLHQRSDKHRERRERLEQDIESALTEIRRESRAATTLMDQVGS